MPQKFENILNKAINDIIKKRENISSEINIKESEYFRTLVKVNTELSSKLKECYEEKNINDQILQLWLYIRNVINMVHVCEAFYRGAFFYADDNYHSIANSMNKVGLNYYYDMDIIQSIYFINKENKLEQEPDYTIKAKHSPSKILIELLFSNIASECTSGIAIAYYLSILDLLQLVHGKEAGMQHFDDLFGIKMDEVHNLNQMRFGMSGIAWPMQWNYYSPLYLFSIVYGNHNVTLQDIRQHPLNYLGYRFYVQGHKDYFQVHSGSCQGWNLIFYGLDINNEPLFLGVRGMLKPYIFNYADVQMLLRASHNQLPESLQLVKNHQLCEANDLVGWWSHSMVGFNYEIIETMLLNSQQIKLKLKQQTDFCYSKYVLPNIDLAANNLIDQKEKNEAVLDKIRKQTSFTKDDHHPSVLNFLKKKPIRPDYLKFNFFTRDDLALLQEEQRIKMIKINETETPLKIQKFSAK